VNDACNVCGCTLDDEMCLNPDCYPCGVRDERGRFRKKLIRCRVCGGPMLNQQFCRDAGMADGLHSECVETPGRRRSDR